MDDLGKTRCSTTGEQDTRRSVERFGEWRPIETAPKDGTAFLVAQDGEVFVARYTRDYIPRLCYRMHSLRVESAYRVITIDLDGQKVEAQVPINQPWREIYEHNWVLWTRGFKIAPTEWCPITTPTPVPQTVE